MTKVWQIWGDLEPYLLQLLLGAIALFALAKDWGDYVEKFGKPKTLLLFTVTIVVIVLTLLETHNTRRETRGKEQAAASKDAANTKQIEVLTEQVRLGREENNKNSEGFRSSFTALYDKYSELASRVQSAELLQELHKTQRDLQDTQLKLVQPKAALTAGFWSPHMTFDNLSRETTVSKSIDGTVTVAVTVANPSDVAALNGTYAIRICQACKFAKEPVGLSRLAGSQDQDRQKVFERILSRTSDEIVTLDIIPPPSSVNRFEVDVIYSCVNCVWNRIPMFVSIE